MPEAPFRVILAPEAEADLEQIVGYWADRAEGWRGEKYFRDLSGTAQRELADPAFARRGRPLKNRKHAGAREFLAFRVYRIIYRIDETAGVVNVLRFWHAHRDETHGDA